MNVTDAASQIILHNYPQSPVAEKARVALGIKGLSWRSVEIPRLPPKPLLTPLTGGYRRTPVMQIGADIYCDSWRIIQALDRLHPQPGFYPTADAGLARALSRWTDGPLFDLSVKIVLGSAGDALPQDFAEDRGKLYLGPNWAEGLKRANTQLPHLVAQLRAPLTWLNEMLGDGRRYLLGEAPGAIDAQVYCAVWFIRGRWAGGAEMLSEFPALERWEETVMAIGHGTPTPMEAEEALAIARAAAPQADTGVAPGEPQGLTVGAAVTVSPDAEGGEQPVEGRVRYADADTIVVERDTEDLGQICVHFPRAGYRIET